MNLESHKLLSTFAFNFNLRRHREAANIGSGGVPLSEIAVLYRTHSQSRPLEEAFIRAGVPHVAGGGGAYTPATSSTTSVPVLAT